MTSSGEVSPASVTPATTPSLGSSAPKYGTVIPNRIFVGGIAANTTAQELKQFFSSYGNVQESKIITDRAGISKGYGFITFETLEDAEKIIKKEADNLVFKDRKLNIGPAVKKQAFPRIYEPSVSPGTVMFTNGVPYTYQNGMAIFQSQDPTAYHVPTQPAASAYPMMMPSQQVAYVSQPGYAYPTQKDNSSYYNDQLYRQAAALPAAHYAAAATQNQWRWTAAQQSPTAASYLAYPTMPAVSPEMYAQATAAGHAAPTATYQPTEMEAGMMEAAPAEGSMVMEPTLQRAYVDPTTGQYSLTAAPHPQQPTTTYQALQALTHHHHHQQQTQEQQHHQQQATSAANVVVAVSHPSSHPANPVAQQSMAGPSNTVIPVHRTPVAYKRPLPQSSRKILGTPTVSLSPRATPPSKVLITQQRMMSHMGPPPLPSADLLHGEHPLTPPITPEVLNHV